MYIMMTSSNGNIFRVTGPLCGEFTGLGEFPTQRPVTRSFDVFFDLRLNKRLSKQPWGWWSETPSSSLWRHRNVIFARMQISAYTNTDAHTGTNLNHQPTTTTPSSYSHPPTPTPATTPKTLQWRHDGCDGVSNHHPYHCLINRLFRRRSSKTSKLRATGLCAGNSPMTGDSPHKRPVTLKMFQFDDVIMMHPLTFTDIHISLHF